MTHRPDRGSTLIELLISLTILGVILLIIMGAFSLGIRAWETGDRDVDAHQRQQMVFSILKRQLSSAVNQPVVIEEDEKMGTETKKGENPFVFRGDEASMEFNSAIPAVPGNMAGNVHVAYRVGAEDESEGYFLEITEKNVFVQSGGKKTDAVKEPTAHRLLSGVHGIEFAYLKITPEDSLWQEEWNPENDDAGFPAAVRCILQMTADKAPITLIARLPETESR
jgi:general secretion pathway protein J